MYRTLIDCPSRIFEDLLMSKQTEAAAAVVRALPAAELMSLLYLAPADIEDGTVSTSGRPGRSGSIRSTVNAGGISSLGANTAGPVGSVFAHDLLSLYATRAIRRLRSPSAAAAKAGFTDGELLPLSSSVSSLLGTSGATGFRPPAVTWVNDVDAPKCMICEQDFNVMRRRHHCRLCGRVVCNPCSDNKTFNREIMSEVRTCDDCCIQQAAQPSIVGSKYHSTNSGSATNDPHGLGVATSMPLEQPYVTSECWAFSLILFVLLFAGLLSKPLCTFRELMSTAGTRCVVFWLQFHSYNVFA
jgi:hypothetical protein